jgi:hypothetical protein
VFLRRNQAVKGVASASITLDTVCRRTVSALTDGSYTSTQVQNISGTVSDNGNATLTVNGLLFL